MFDPRIGNWQFQKVKSKTVPLFKPIHSQEIIGGASCKGLPCCAKCGKHSTLLAKHEGVCETCYAIINAPRCDAPDEEFYGKKEAPKADAPKPKFKVGDRVKVVNDLKHHCDEVAAKRTEYVGTTAIIEKKETCSVSDAPNCDGWTLEGLSGVWFCDRNLELIPSTPQIDASKIGRGDWVKCRKFEGYPTFADAMHPYVGQWMRLSNPIFDDKNGKMFIGDDGWQWPATAIIAHSKERPSDA